VEPLTPALERELIVESSEHSLRRLVAVSHLPPIDTAVQADPQSSPSCDICPLPARSSPSPVSLGASQVSFKVSSQSCLLYASNLVSLSPGAASSEGASISYLRFSLSRRHCQRTIFFLERSTLGDCVSNVPVRTLCEIFTDFVHPRSVNLKLHESDALLCAADLLENFLFLKQIASSSDEDSVNANQPAIQSVVVIAYIGSRGICGSLDRCGSTRGRSLRRPQ
jgi:hypothetical protein